ncbi:MAG TPA: thioredoxin domain-containing protein [Actinomycetota bacterium]|nr:thioredoxin domain-containing protein [Actinomycetota bacterium]
MANRLAAETSPYLIQHKDNPVDWYPWGEEALARARDEDKPILLSVGYAACHWCHVMEHESFEDPATAAIMNEHFVAVKVDREERPDIDAIYMEAVQTMTGQGGWPMTVFLTPQGLPFYGGTYFPPEERYGMPSFSNVLHAITDAWQSRRDDVELQGKRLVEHLNPIGRIEPSSDDVTRADLHQAFDKLRQNFDPDHGGFGGAPKFPQPMTLDLAIRLALRDRPDARTLYISTLDRMAAGGIFDQIGGGFHRYSVDRAWIVPHFEKMLYDNAQLLRTYARAWAQDHNPRYAEIVALTAGWLLREMRDPEGGFWSSLDADSEGVEGKFYVWEPDEIRALLGDESSAGEAYWGVTPEGNFEGKNILLATGAEPEPEVLGRWRETLMQARDQRVRPGTDTKVITAWNALTAAAFAEAGTIFSRKEWIEVASEAMRFTFDGLVRDGRLMRSYREGRAQHLGFCEDHAAVIEACLALFEATQDVEWLERARSTADAAITLFHDEAGPGFFTAGNDAEQLVTRSKDVIDNAVPSANSVMALQLQKLTLLTGDNRYEDRSLEVMRLLREAAINSPLAFAHLLEAVDFYTGNPREVVIVGAEGDHGTEALVETVRARWDPGQLLLVGNEGTVDLPLFRDRKKADGLATAYVCHRGVCHAPVTTPEELARQLDADR